MAFVMKTNILKRLGRTQIPISCAYDYRYLICHNCCIGLDRQLLYKRVCVNQNFRNVWNRLVHTVLEKAQDVLSISELLADDDCSQN